MFCVPLAGVSLFCFSSGVICLFLHLLSLLSLYIGGPNRPLCMLESLMGLSPPLLLVHHPNANTTWLGQHVMAHPTERAWHNCRVPAVLIRSSSQTWLAANGSDNNIFSVFPRGHKIPILETSLKMACLRIPFYTGFLPILAKNLFHIKGWQVVVLLMTFRKV